MNTTTTPPEHTTTTPPEQRPRTLTRRRDDRMLAGVASGIAGYVGVDALLIRIGFAVLTIVGGVGIPLYIACWLLIPDEGATESIATDFTSSLHDWRN
jgi:phage shock protein C